MCAYTTTSVFRLGRSVLHEEYDPIKNEEIKRNKIER